MANLQSHPSGDSSAGLPASDVENQAARLLIIIPAYNEQGAIHQVVSGVRQTVPQADVLVINDGSADNTALRAEAAGALVVQHPFNLGIGGAVQTGLKFARDHGYDYVIRLDGDGQHQAAEIHMLLRALQSRQADMVVGSRFIDADVDWHIPWPRRVGIAFFGWAVTQLIGYRATDTTSGFCGMNRAAIEVLATYLPQDYPDVESRVIIHKAGLRQVELPVNMRARVAGVSSINSWKSVYYAFKVSVAMLTSALKEIAPATPATLGASSASAGAVTAANRQAPSANGFDSGANGHSRNGHASHSHDAGGYSANGHGSNGNGVAYTHGHSAYRNGAAVQAGAELVQPPVLEP